MNGKEYFINCCKSYNIDYNALFKIGSGKKVGDRFKYSLSSEISDTQKYAIKYFEDEDIFVVWNISPNHYANLSLAREKGIVVTDKKILTVNKGIGYANRKQEQVIVFKSKMVDKFLKDYILEK